MSAIPKAKKPAFEIGRETRLDLFRMQLELRMTEKRAFDLFLQNLIKGTSHLALGPEATTTRSAPIVAMHTRWRAVRRCPACWAS